MEGFVVAGAGLLLFGLWVYLFVVIVGDMARIRGHSPWLWWLVSLAWSPIASILILWTFFDIVDAEEN